MKILLIHSQHETQRYGTGMYKKNLRYAPLTMPTLAALVPKELNATVRVIDEMVEPVDFDYDADIVGVTAISSASTRAYEIARRFKDKGSTVVLGGIHASLMPEEAKKHVDVVVKGYADLTWPQLLRDYAKGELKSFYNQPGHTDVGDIVVPDRSHIKRSKYVANNTVEMSRGCNKRCDFCVTHRLNENYLTKDLDRVIREIKALPGKMVTFLDPNVIGNISYAKRFFTELRKLRKWWVGCVSIDVYKQTELLDLMVKSGAKGFLIGFESLNQEALNSVNKGFSQVDIYQEAIEHFHSRGILVQGSFVFGFDTDEPEIFDRTVDFVIKTKIDLPQFTIYTPFPGTPAFDRYESQGRLLTRDWSLYNGHNVVFQPANMTPEELRDGVRHVWNRVYSIPSILKRLWGKPFLPKPVALLSNLNFRRFMKRVHFETYDKQEQPRLLVPGSVTE